MCKAKELLDRYKNLTQEILQERRRLIEGVSSMDRKLSTVYHKIETTKFNACQGYEYSRAIQEITQKRRIYKQELRKINMLHDDLGIRAAYPKSKGLANKVRKADEQDITYKKNFKYNTDDETEIALPH